VYKKSKLSSITYLNQFSKFSAQLRPRFGIGKITDALMHMLYLLLHVFIQGNQSRIYIFMFQYISFNKSLSLSITFFKQ